MVSLCFTCWRSVVRSSDRPLVDAYEGWPPLKLYIDGHIDLEFAPFILADNAFMDKASFENLVKLKASALNTSIESIKRLHGEGIIVLRDFDKELKSIRTKILDATEARIHQSDEIRAALQHSVEVWDRIGINYAKSIGRGDDLLATLPIGILSGLAANSSPITLDNVNKVRKVLYKKGNLSRQEREIIGEMARPYIDHVHTNIGLFRQLRVPVIDWEDVVPVYKKIMSLNIDSDIVYEKKIPKLRELFSVALSSFEPSNCREFLSLIKDSRIKYLREFVDRLSEGDIVIDKKITDEIMKKLSEITMKASKSGTVLNVVGAAAGLITSIFDGGITASIITGVGVSGAQEVVSRQIGELLNQDVRWFLCLVDAKNSR
jgi:hypothetical protein